MDVEFWCQTHAFFNREFQIDVQFLNLTRQIAVRDLQFDIWRENEKVLQIDVYCNCGSACMRIIGCVWTVGYVKAREFKMAAKGMENDVQWRFFHNEIQKLFQYQVVVLQ
jgi:hypothetical protein